MLLTLGLTAILLGVGSLALVAAYPFMKRITWWPQAWLGLTFNWGALLGFAAVSGRIEVPALLLYASGFFWTLGYDTIYAIQDIEDDALAGVKSAARRLGDKVRGGVAVFYAASFVLALAAGYAAGLRIIFFVAAAALMLQLFWQVLQFRPHRRRRGAGAVQVQSPGRAVLFVRRHLSPERSSRPEIFMIADRRAFILANTRLQAPPHTPELVPASGRRGRRRSGG